MNVVRLSYGLFVTGHVICTTPTSPPPPLALAQAVYSCTFPTFCLGTVGTLRPIARLENYLPRVKGRPPVLGLKPTFFRNGVSFVLHSSYLHNKHIPQVTELHVTYSTPHCITTFPRMPERASTCVQVPFSTLV